MKIISLILITVGISAFLISQRKSVPNPSPIPKGMNIGFAVVELFTSEGCSSCPAADEVVAKIQHEDAKQPVYILAFHVDYWNKLGWKDVFSNADYSKRQSDYSNWLKTGSVYTPQIIVNGTKEFVGSEENLLRNSIENGLKKSEVQLITLSDLALRDGKATLKFNIDSSQEKMLLQLAVVQKAGQTVVKRGENGGRTLSHVQIVRNLQTISLNGSSNGFATIEYPKELNATNMEVIAFLQNKYNGEIVGATKLSL